MSTPDTKPPVAKKVDYVHNYHNGAFKIPDPYHWMKDMTPRNKRQDIIGYLNAENQYFDAVSRKPLEPLSEMVYNEFIGRIQEDDDTVPVHKNGYYYYSRTEKGKQYRLQCRKSKNLATKEEVILDLNTMNFEYVTLSNLTSSPDNSLLAYALDTSGDEVHTVHFKRMTDGHIHESDKLTNSSGDIEWANDNKTLYYTTLDSIHRAYAVYKHVLGTPQSSDVKLYEETDEKFSVSLRKSQSDRFLFIVSSSSLTSQTWIVNLEDPHDVMKEFVPREFRHQYKVEHHGDRFLILTNAGGRCLNYKLASCPLDDTSKENWVDVIPYDPFKYLTSIIPFRSHLVIPERSEASTKIRILETTSSGHFDSTSPQHYIEVTDNLYTIQPADGDSQEFNTEKLRYIFSSPISPPQVREYDMHKRDSTLLKQTPCPNFDSSLYETRRLWAPIPRSDQVEAPFDTPVVDRVPLSVIYRKDKFKQDGTGPAFLYGYGSYGICIDPVFNQKIFSYVDRGITYCIAHIRGGGECGRAWYEVGKFQHKKNTFNDFVLAADYLVQEKISTHENMAIEGRSAGGLLMGAVLNLRPNISKVALAGVPFVDVVNTMMDPSIPLTINEYEEWGNPNELDCFNYMLSYSPYENIPAGATFPHLLVKAGLNDPRVAYWEPSKWVAKLRDMEMDGNGKKEIVYDCKMGSGHFGSSGRYAAYKEYSVEYAFVIKHLICTALDEAVAKRKAQ
ncbi:hypothetical protein SeMB42_g07560 [Synchytrium endobioticum]|uniref:Prolyl endopeptidase n=1 Tax=Synchytrium endobioticum TaxID=286115 RepID=A0A507C4L4_9FUNG|nr:hypothetical protein SeMB42_g07560 [Synchytrium endobioticum]TPX46040.1 hypothetical protein SeLEV6574_g03468 [Synchytrium endobioticum]